MTIAFTARSYSRLVLRSLAAACCIATLLAGCGGGSTIQRRHFQSPEAFAAAANSVCVRSRTRGTRLARLHGLVPPVAERDLFDRWLRAEQAALEASRAIAHPRAKSPLVDPRVELAVNQGKIDGYARRLGATMCQG
jgi:hypothetical protein